MGSSYNLFDSSRLGRIIIHDGWKNSLHIFMSKVIQQEFNCLNKNLKNNTTFINDAIGKHYLRKYI